MTKPHLPALVSILRRGETYRALRRRSIYEPIPEGEYIRVLKLRPGRESDDINCSLSIVDIESVKATYEAISYVWGDAKDTVNIWCNGLRVPITVSLADALRNFRHLSEPRVLWADALCINQKDKREKGHQVKRMGKVYANATCTLVWLGCDDQNIAEDAFALILEANSYFADSFLQAGQTLYKMEPFTKPYPICMDEVRWLGVAKVFRFPWFGRVWTVQEAAIAEKCCIFWGSVSIDIADLLELSTWIDLKPDFQGVLWGIDEQFPTLPAKRIALYFYYNIHQQERWQQSRSGLAYIATTFFKDKPFWALLLEVSFLKASDPRDHIYAFLGCPAAIDSKGRTFVETDYTSSIDDLNLRLTYALMEESAEAPFVFSAVTHNSRERLMGDVHPSWLPVWHVVGKSRMAIADSTSWFQAGGTRELFTATDNDERRLSMGARTFDTVIWKSKTIELNQAGSDPTYPSASGLGEIFIDTLWIDVMQSSSQLGITVPQVDLWRSLMLGYPTNRGFSSISDGRQQRMIDAYRKSISVAGRVNQEAVMEVDKIQDATWVKQSLKDLENASIFLTRDARIGIAPLGDLVEVGDVCCIIFGATVPFLFTPPREGRHKLVGECYIHGVMNGELMEQFIQSDLSEHHIVLE